MHLTKGIFFSFPWEEYIRRKDKVFLLAIQRSFPNHFCLLGKLMSLDGATASAIPSWVFFFLFASQSLVLSCPGFLLPSSCNVALVNRDLFHVSLWAKMKGLWSNLPWARAAASVLCNWDESVISLTQELTPYPHQLLHLVPAYGVWSYSILFILKFYCS